MVLRTPHGIQYHPSLGAKSVSLKYSIASRMKTIVLLFKSDCNEEEHGVVRIASVASTPDKMLIDKVGSINCQSSNPLLYPFFFKG